MYVLDTTLGHGGLFNWLMDVDGTIEIRRRFAGGQISVTTYSPAELERLNSFVAGREWTALASDVAKLHHGTEREGLGRFLRESMGRSLEAAQGASQLAAIFVKAGVWADNGKKRGMAFRCLDLHWQAALQTYYKQRQQAQVASCAHDELGAGAESETQQLYFLDVTADAAPRSTRLGGSIRR